MKYGCANKECKFHKKTAHVIKNGSYKRKSDSAEIRRYRCKHCGKCYSSATFAEAYNQKKRRVNVIILKLLASGVSMRRCAILLNIHRTTVKRKLIFLANKARLSLSKFIESIRNTVESMQFDDLITLEHTKMKPLSISVACTKNGQTILGGKVSQIPAFGLLASLSRQKYGRRKSYHKQGLESLFNEIRPAIKENALIESDKHKLYPEMVEKHFPNAIHKTYEGRKGAVAGQGELKKIGFDPLFSINHTLATLRANINRLFRRTWCTTKDPEMLQNHLDIFIYYYNQKILRQI